MGIFMEASSQFYGSITEYEPISNAIEFFRKLVVSGIV
jgi:hypothetical protein